MCFNAQLDANKGVASLVDIDHGDFHQLFRDSLVLASSGFRSLSCD